MSTSLNGTSEKFEGRSIRYIDFTFSIPDFAPRFDLHSEIYNLQIDFRILPSWF